MAKVGYIGLGIMGGSIARNLMKAGHELVVESKDERTGDPLTSVQWLLFGSSGFVQMFGIARKDQWAEALPRMRTLRDGFERK